MTLQHLQSMFATRVKEIKETHHPASCLARMWRLILDVGLWIAMLSMEDADTSQWIARLTAKLGPEGIGPNELAAMLQPDPAPDESATAPTLERVNDLLLRYLLSDRAVPEDELLKVGVRGLARP